MKNIRSLTSFCLFGVLLAVLACGKKGPPFLPEKEFSAGVIDLTGEWVKGEIVLRGIIHHPPGSREARDLIRGSRVYYSRYPLEDPPCAGCPIQFQGYDTFGKEVIAEERFLCRVPGEIPAQVYFFKVRLIGPEEAIGPPSNTVKVVVESQGADKGLK